MLLNHPTDTNNFEAVADIDLKVFGSINLEEFQPNITFDSDDEQLLLSNKNDGLSDDEPIDIDELLASTAHNDARISTNPKSSQKEEEEKKDKNLGSYMCHVGVMIRIRPPELHPDRRTEQRVIDTDISRTHLNLRLFGSSNHSFTFDHVLDENSPQMTVLQNAAKPYIKEALKGFNVSILAFGGMRSGKRYTLNGMSNTAERGLIARSFEFFCEQITSAKDQNEYVVGVQYLNIDGDNIVDLIDPNNQDVAVLDYNCNLVLHGATTLYVRSVSDVQSIINLENDDCADLSRSAQIFFITIARHNTATGENSFNYLSFIRLPPNNHDETHPFVTRVRSLTDKNAPGDINTEGPLMKILCHVIGGNFKTLVLCCVNSTKFDAENSLANLEVAHKAMDIVNYPIPSSGSSPSESKLAIALDTVEKQSKEIEDLKEEISQLRMQQSNSPYGKISEQEEIVFLRKKIHQLHKQAKDMKKQCDDARIQVSNAESQTKEYESECINLNKQLRTTQENLNIMKYDKAKAQKAYENRILELQAALEKSENMYKDLNANFEDRLHRAKVGQRDRANQILAKAENVVKTYAEKRKETKQKAKNELRECIKSQILEMQQLKILKMRVEESLAAKIDDYVELKTKVADKEEETKLLEEELRQKNDRLEQQHQELLGLAKIKVESDQFHQKQIDKLKAIFKLYEKSGVKLPQISPLKEKKNLQLMRSVATPIKRKKKRKKKKQKHILDTSAPRVTATEFDFL